MLGNIPNMDLDDIDILAILVLTPTLSLTVRTSENIGLEDDPGKFSEANC